MSTDHIPLLKNAACCEVESANQHNKLALYAYIFLWILKSYSYLRGYFNVSYNSGCVLVMRRSRTSRFYEPAPLHERWESAPV